MNSYWEKLPDALKENPLFQFSAETDYVPAWDKIRPGHIEPAMQAACALAREAINKIKINRAAPTFRNTAEALENALALPGYIARVVFCAMPKNANDQKDYDEAAGKADALYSALYADIFAEESLFERLRTLNATTSAKKLGPERSGILEMYMEGFREGGAGKPAEYRAQMHALGQQISALSAQAQTNMRLAEENTFFIVREAERLKGLPEELIKAAARQAQEKGMAGSYVFGMRPETYKTFMASAQDRNLRQGMYETYSSVASTGPHDNRQTILDLIRLEYKLARLRGYRNPASYILQYNLADNAKTVEKFLGDLRRAAKPRAVKELSYIATLALLEDGIKDMEGYDVAYYREKLQKKVLGFDGGSLNPYFELNHTLGGVFRHFEKLFGVTFTETKDRPKYHDDLRFFRVADKRTGKAMGLVCLDLFAREGKPAGTAWNMGVLPQGLFEGKVRRPFDVIVTKFTKGQDGEPTLIGHDGAVILLHELGHAMHNMLSRCRYQSLSGTGVRTDFVEFPSQIQEEWAYEPEVLDNLARHYKTGESLPPAVKEKISESRKFMAGYSTLYDAERSWLDLCWHRKDPHKTTDVQAFEIAVLSKFRLPDRDKKLLSPRFSHIHGGGYESAFYSYQWAECMARSVFEKFQKAGLYDKTLSREFRKVLEKGWFGCEDAALQPLLGHRTRGLNPAFLRSKGLALGTEFNYAAALAAPAALPGPANANEKPEPVLGKDTGTPRP